MDNELKRLGLRRHNPVGKRVGNNVYIHISYIFDLYRSLPGLFTHKPTLKEQSKNWPQPGEYDPKFQRIDRGWNIYRLNIKTFEQLLICCPKFDEEKEPIITKTSKRITKGKITYHHKNPPIYHHKWMFVKDDYQGFDVEASKRRSLEWFPLAKGNRQMLSRIGRLKYWQKFLLDNNLKL